jgi:uncharacterized protein
MLPQMHDGLWEEDVNRYDFKIRVPNGRRVSMRHYCPVDQTTALRVTYVMGPGGNYGHDSIFIVNFARRFAARGLDVVTFNFPFLEKGSKRPDSDKCLRECYQEVLNIIIGTEALRNQPVIAGGKCMGGWIASLLAASPEGLSQPVAGLIFLGYPLHPPQRPELLRVNHLLDITVPMLFVQGTRDQFGIPNQLEPAINGLTVPASIKPVYGGDHSFCLPRKWEQSNPQLWDNVADDVMVWVKETVPRASIHLVKS